MQIIYDALLKEGHKYLKGKKPNLAQRAFHLDTKPGFNMACGGLGSGKSYALAMKLFELSAINQDMPGGLLCPTIKEFKRDMLPIFSELISLYAPETKYHKTDLFFMFPWSNAPLYIFTAEADIKGPNLAYGGINEFSSMERDRIQQLINRCRREGSKLIQIAMAGTPEDDFLWLDEFIEQQEKAGNIRVHQLATFNNSHLDPAYLKLLKDTLDPQAYKLYVLGERLRLGGKYFYYSYDPKINDFEINYDPELVVYANLDFNVGNMSATFAHVIGSGMSKQLLFFDELVLTDYGSDTASMGRAILERFPVEKVLITCDASGAARKTSGQSDKKILESLGFTVRCKSANPRLRKRQIMVNGLLAKGNILLNPKTCVRFKRDLQRVEQDERTFEKVKKNPELTHTSDGADYLADFEYPNWLDKDSREKFFIKNR